MAATYTDQTGKMQNYFMGCYGIGVTRTLAMIYENSIIRKMVNLMVLVCLLTLVHIYYILFLKQIMRKK